MFGCNKKKPLPVVDESDDSQSDTDKKIYDVVEEVKEDIEGGEIIDTTIGASRTLKDSVMDTRGLGPVEKLGTFSLILNEILSIINGASTAEIVSTLTSVPSDQIDEIKCDQMIR